MPGKFSASCQAAVANPRTIGMLIGHANKRGEIEAFSFGNESAPADNMIIHELLRFTASGTATAVTVTKKNEIVDANVLTVEENASAEPTFTGGEIFRLGIAHRGTYTRQYAKGSGIFTNVTTDNGVGHRATHASATPNANTVFEWEE